MCGFFGIWSRDGSRSISTAYGRRPRHFLTAARTMRVICSLILGRSSSSLYRPGYFPGVPGPLSAIRVRNLTLHWVFVACRSSISAAGHQPMGATIGNYWIVFNGEVYNYLELRDELVAGMVIRNANRHGGSAGRVSAMGSRLLKRLNGMWAFAIWDNRLRNLFLARDRFGIKPLFFAFKHRSTCLRIGDQGAVELRRVPFRPCQNAVAAYVTIAAMPSHRKGATFYERIQSSAEHPVNRSGTRIAK